MNSILKTAFLISLLLTFMASCTRDDATAFSLTKESVTLKVGQTDTIRVTINFTGDADNIPITAQVSDGKVASAEVIDNSKETKSASNLTISRSVVVKALSSGATKVVIKAGSKTTTVPVSNSQTNFTMKQSVVINYGLALEEIDNSVFIMCLLPETFFVDTASAIIAGTGQYIHFQAFAAANQSSFATGSFCQSNKGNVNTFLPGAYDTVDGVLYPYGTYIETVDADGKSIYTLVKSGTYTANAEGDNYKIEGELVTETNEIIHFSYTGAVNVVDRVEKAHEVHPDFTKGQLYFAGDVYNKGRSNTFLVYLETSNVDLNANTLDGEVLLLQINAYDFYENHVSTGIYKMLTKAQYEALALSPFTLVPGSFELFRDKVTNYGCWYYDSNSRKRLISGSIDVTYEKDNYTIKYSLSDRIGSVVSGSYSGKLSYVSLLSGAPAKTKSIIEKENSNFTLPVLMRQQNKNFGKLPENGFNRVGMK